MVSFSIEKMTFLLRGHHQWRLSTQTPPHQRTTHSPPPTPTTAATGTTPNLTMTPTPTLATMETRARPSPLLPMLHMDTDRPRTQATSQPRAQHHCPVTLSPRQRRQHRLQMAATHSRRPRLSWSPQTLPRPPRRWCAAMVLWASSRWWRRRTGSTRTLTPWARPRWSGWERCPSWCPPRAEQARWSEIRFVKLTKLVLVVTFEILWRQTVCMSWSSPLPFTTVFRYVLTFLSENKLGFYSAEFI